MWRLVPHCSWEHVCGGAQLSERRGHRAIGTEARAPLLLVSGRDQRPAEDTARPLSPRVVPSRGLRVSLRPAGPQGVPGSQGLETPRVGGSEPAGPEAAGGPRVCSPAGPLKLLHSKGTSETGARPPPPPAAPQGRPSCIFF